MNTIQGKTCEVISVGSTQIFGNFIREKDVPIMPKSTEVSFCIPRFAFQWVGNILSYSKMLVPPSPFHFQCFQILLQSQCIHYHFRFYIKYNECSVIFCMKCKLSETFLSILKEHIKNLIWQIIGLLYTANIMLSNNSSLCIN